MEENKNIGEYVQLPSKGIFYKDQFKGLSQLKVRPLNWQDEDILTTKSYYDNGTIFDELLKNTIVDENGFSHKQLIPVDRDTILWWLRIGAFGPIYNVNINCKNLLETGKQCNNKIKAIWDLSKFIIPEINPLYKEEIERTGGIKIQLPVSKLECKISIGTIGRTTEIKKNLENKKVKTKTTKDFNNTLILLSSIVEVYKGEEIYKNSEDILKWLSTGWEGNPIPIVDSRYVLEKTKQINLRVETKQEIICDVCGNVEEVDMPMSITFFWPDFE